MRFWHWQGWAKRAAHLNTDRTAPDARTSGTPQPDASASRLRHSPQVIVCAHLRLTIWVASATLLCVSHGRSLKFTSPASIAVVVCLLHEHGRRACLIQSAVVIRSAGKLFRYKAARQPEAGGGNEAPARELRSPADCHCGAATDQVVPMAAPHSWRALHTAGVISRTHCTPVLDRAYHGTQRKDIPTCSDYGAVLSGPHATRYVSPESWHDVDVDSGGPDSKGPGNVRPGAPVLCSAAGLLACCSSSNSGRRRGDASKWSRMCL